LPEKGLNAKTDELLTKKLEEYKKGLTAEEIDHLLADTIHLKQYQDEPSDKADMEKIPMLTREDLKKEAAPFQNEEEDCDGTLLLKHEMFTGGITYVTLMFDLAQILEEDVPYLGLMKAILGYVDTENYTYADLANEINLITGGVSSYIAVYPSLQKRDDFTVKYEIRARLLEEKTGQAFALFKEILTTSSLKDEKRIYEILAQVKSRLQMSLSSAGHSVSAIRAMSYFSKSARYNDMTGGIALYRLVADIEKNFEEKKDDFLKKMQELICKVFRSENMMISITADDKGIHTVKQNIPAFNDCLFTQKVEKTECKIHCEKKNEGLKDASQVQYVSRAGNFMDQGYEYNGALRILKVILSYDYLWLNIRVKGGAYGCMSGFSRMGDCYFSSYRDPNLRKTNEIFEKTPEYLENFAVDERDMTKYIIGTISDLDTPLNPSARGHRSTSAYLSGLTYELAQQERDEIIGAQIKDIQSLSGLVQAVLDAQCLCVIGSEEALDAEKEMFENLVNLY
jgi:Zn-dependent M16 (insulinase) family peptidase